MRKILAILLFLMASSYLLHGQALVVKEFRCLPDEHIPDETLTDANGDPVAMLKVYAEGLGRISFDGAVGDVLRNQSGYTLYVTANIWKINYKVGDEKTWSHIDVKKYIESLEANKVYQIILEKAPEEAPKAIMTISSPAGTVLRVNGDLKDSNEWTGSLKPGRCVVEALRDGVVVAHEEPNFEATIKAEPYEIKEPTGSITVSDGGHFSYVTLDGNLVGVTEICLDGLSVGKHVVVVENKGYETVTRTVTVSKDENINLNINLVPVAATKEPEPSETVVAQPVAATKEPNPSKTVVAQPVPQTTTPVVKEKKENKEKKQKEIVNKGALFLMGDVAYCNGLTYGGMLGWCKSVGLYAKYRGNFVSVESTATCSSNYAYDDGGYLWATGQKKESRTVMSGGLMFRIGKYIYPYAGAGYGIRSVYWEDFDGSWAKVSDYSSAGVGGEAGIVFKFDHMSLSIGAGYYNSCVDGEIGVGLSF